MKIEIEGMEVELVQKIVVENRKPVTTGNSGQPKLLFTEDGFPVYALPGGGEYVYRG